MYIKKIKNKKSFLYFDLKKVHLYLIFIFQIFTLYKSILFKLYNFI